MKFNRNILREYLSQAPISLALERSLEGEIFTTLQFERPILDIGCGEGLFAKIVFAEKIETGIDPNSKELDRAKTLDAYEELICCGGDAISKPDQSYQTVFSNSVLEHIKDLEPVFRETLRLLKPGGHFYITVPSQYFERYTIVASLLDLFGLNRLSLKYREFFNQFWVHHHAYALEDWEKLCEGYGFEVVKSFTYNTQASCLLNDALVPASLPSLALKKLINRWALFPLLRKTILFPIARTFKRLASHDAATINGGLVFIELRKPNL